MSRITIVTITASVWAITGTAPGLSNDTAARADWACCTGDVCTEASEDDCYAAGGFWLGGITCPPANPENPCAQGACCFAPATCLDTAPYDTPSGCADAGGVYVGGACCEDYDCPVCAFYDVSHCQLFDIDGGYMLFSDRSGPDAARRADDFRPASSLISHICWTAGYVAPDVGECVEDPPTPSFLVRFFEDDGGLPGTELPPLGGQVVGIEAGIWRGSGSRLWDYQGVLPTTVTVPVGDCVWMELSGMGEGPGGCRVYVVEAIDANQHGAFDSNNDGVYDGSETDTLDIQFCVDSGLASSDGCGPVLGSCCTCPAVCTPGVTQIMCQQADGGLGGVWTLNGSCEPNPCPGIPANDDCADAQVITGLIGGDVDVDFQNVCATDDGGGELSEGDCPGNGPNFHFDLWYRYVAEDFGSFTASLCEQTNLDTMVAFYDGSAGCTPTDDIACGDDTCGLAGGPSEVSLNVPAGQELLIRVGVWYISDIPTMDPPRGEGTITFSFGPLVLGPPQTPGWPHSAPKNRYISFVPGVAGPDTAYKLTLTDSLYFPGAEGQSWWVGEPDEDGIAQVVAEPYFSAVWPEVIHAGGCPVVPVATYDVYATWDGVNLSSPLVVGTIERPISSSWGDCVGSLEGDVWSAPNGVVNVYDMLASIISFRGDPTQSAPPLTWMDVAPETPDGVINLLDVYWIMSTFAGASYPFSDPASCP